MSKTNKRKVTTQKHDKLKSQKTPVGRKQKGEAIMKTDQGRESLPLETNISETKVATTSCEEISGSGISCNDDGWDNEDDEDDKNLDLHMDEILEELEGVDTSDSVVLLVQDSTARADQRKADLSNRRALIQNRLQDLEELRIQKELGKLNIY